MKVIVGLGNPGKRYANTRHNIGQEVVLELARRHAGQIRARAKFDGEYLHFRWGPEELLLVFPLTYMNESGRCVRQFTDFYKVPLASILVVCDDFNLPFGRIRMRAGGSAGGQNGLDDILQRLGNDQIPRLRIGIGPLESGWNAADFVLGRFPSEQRSALPDLIGRAADAAETWISEGIQQAMSRHNAADKNGSDKAPES